MQKSEVGKIGAIGIVIIFVFGAFAPAIGSASNSEKQVLSTKVSAEENNFYEEKNFLQLNKSNLQINNELDLHDITTQDESSINLLKDNPNEGYAPLDTPETFYEKVGYTYTKPTTYMELVSWYQHLEQNYSDYIQVFKANELYGTGTVPKTGGGSYDLYYVRITNESRGFDKPEVLFEGGHHGNEKIGAISLYWTLDWLMRHAFHPDYDCPERDYLRWLLDNREIYIDVNHNPDGFDRNVRVDYLGRDLNREHDHAASWGPFTSVNGQTMMRFVNNHTLRTAAYFHTGARLLVYPWHVEHSSITGVSPISGLSIARVPADFFFFDAAFLRLGDYIGDYGGNLGPNQIGSSYSKGMGGGGASTSWALAGNNLTHPIENQYVDIGPHCGTGFLSTTVEMYGTGDPAQSMFGNDTINRFGAEVRRIVLYLTDLAQPSVHWTNGTTEENVEINVGESLNFTWLVHGSLVVDNTRIQYSTHPDPINNPMYYTANIDDHNGDYYGGTYWDDALDGSSTPTNYHEEINFDTPGDYFIVAKAMVDQKYAELLRSDYYGPNSYLRIINERTNGSFSESLIGTDGLQEINGQLWWYSPVLHVRVAGMEMAPWYNNNWTFRKEILINHTMVDGDLSAFPVVVDITDIDLANKAQSNGNDILFTDGYNNKLNHEIEYYADGHLIVWVKIPVLLSSDDTILYMYYGNSTCASQQNASGVWDANYMLVQHLSETTGTHYDSTGNDNNGAPFGGVAQDAAGQIDGADDFDGFNDYVEIPHDNTISGFTQALTASAWIRTDGNTSWVTILNKYNASNSQRGWQVYYDGSENPKRLHFVLADTATHYYSYLIDFNAATDTWYHISATWQTNQVPIIYVNGVAYTPTPTTTISSIYNNPLEPLFIGRAYVGGTSNGRFFDGIIDEVRISNIARSEAWEQTSYQNQFDPDNFVTVGLEEGPMFIYDPSPAHLSQGVPRSTSLLSFNITHLQGKPMDYTVETSPDIGSASNTGVYDGRYTVSISGLNDCTDYVWYVNVTAGGNSTTRRFEFTTECQDPWWDADWLYRKKITIDSDMVPADLTDFPVLIHFFDSDVGNKAQTDGDDIVFADRFGVQLNHEIENFQSNVLTAWVKIPTLLFSQDTYIYLYYGNALAESQQNPSGVWDSNFMLVQHLSESSGAHYDSTSHDNDGTAYVINQDASGKIDGADEFDGTDDYVEVPHDDSLAGFTEAMTASTWIKLDDVGSRQTILNKYDITGNQRSWALDFEREEGTEFGFIGSVSPGTSFVAYLYDSVVLSETWYYVTVVWQANQVPKMYVNGVQLSTTETATLSNLYNNPSAPLFLGRAYDVTPERYLDGVIDEVQISNIARSAAWIVASYRNQNNPLSFLAVGSEESEHPLISDPLPVNGATNIAIINDQLSFHLTDRQGDSMNYTVDTSPDIGSDSANNVYNGRYTISISGLAYETTYTWFVNVTDGEHASQQVFTFTTERAPIPWWNTDWVFRKEIILDHTKIAEDFYNFPLLLSFNDSDVRVKARKDGNDVVFADDSGNKLDFEFEYYHKGVLKAWVRIPYLSSSVDTSIMVYYGNGDAENQENPGGVWDTNYMMVQHLSETSGVHYDSTGNYNDGNPYGGVIQGTIGLIDGADEFDGNNDYVQVAHDDTLSGFTQGMTASAWVKFDSTSVRRAIVGKYAIAQPQRSWNVEYIVSPSRALQFTASADGSSTYSYWYANVGTPSTGTWYHVAVGWQSNETPTFYLNGNEISVTTSSGANLTQLYNNVNTPLYIGRTYTTDRYWDGSIDELRVSNIYRSADWIKTSYENQLNPSNFCELKDEEMGIAPAEPFLYDEEPLDESIIVPLNPTLSISVLDYQDDIIDVAFRTNASGFWVTIGSYTNGLSQTYTQETSTMNTYFTTYYWSVNCTDIYQHWSNKTYSFITRDANYPPTLTNPSPSHGATGVAPVPSLAITVNDIDENLLTILIKSNYSGSWEILDSFMGVPSGTYSLLPAEMNEQGKTYYWSVNCTDGVIWVNQTYRFTMSSTLLTLKWTNTYSSIYSGEIVAGDINGDGVDEIFIGGSTSYCIDGITGNVIWQRSVIGGSGKPLLADCNGDEILDLIVTISASGIEVLHGANGTTYWRRTGLGGSSMNHPVAFDINADGCAEVFYSSQDITAGWNGTGRITSLTHDGRIVNQIFAYRPCAGGLSLADTNFDGQFELYMGDRHQSYSGDGGVPRGLRAFLIDEDGTIRCNWNRSDILMSSHCPMIADVNGDGKLDIIVCHQVGGIWVIDSTTGATIKGAYTIYCSDGQRFPGHYQPSLCDIDGDGHIELLAADGTHPEPYTTDDVIVWDLVSWNEIALLPHICEMGPSTGDVTGDGQPDVLVSSFNGLHLYTWNHSSNSMQFLEQRTGLSGTLGPAVLTDVDGDGYNEIIVASSSGRIYVYDVPAPQPIPQALAEIQFYSTYRNGQAIYTEPPGIPRPLVKDVFPTNNSIDIDVMPQLSFRVIDYQHDPITITVSTNASGPWTDLASYANMKTGNVYSIPYCLLMNVPGTDYYWRVTATDGNHTTIDTFKLTTYSPGPFIPGWLYRRKIVLNQSQIESDLENFPVLIDITDTEIGLHAKTNGDDLLFTNIDGETILDYEIESYDSSTGHLVAWVKTNIAASNGTIIYLYYGNETATSHENPESVWDTHFMMVQHLSEISGTVYDSTLYQNDGTAFNGVMQDTVGKIDGADEFDGTNDYITVPHNDSLAGFTEGLTGSTWLKLDTVARRQTILCKYNTAGNQRGYYLDYVNSPSSFHLYASSDGITGVYWTAACPVVAGQWYHIAFTWAPNTIPKIYVNGQKLTIARTDLLSTIYNNTIEPLRLGNSYVTARQIDGMLDEIRISDIARSEAWIQTSYNNQMDPSNFYSISSELTRFSLLVTTSGNGTGTIEVSPEGPYYPDQVVTLWANATNGSVFTGWSGDATSSTTPLYLVMDSDKEVNAEFLYGVYLLTVSSDPAWSGSIVKDPDQAAYNLGEEVELTAVPNADWAFVNWSGDLTGTTNPSTITITGNMTVTASFKPLYDDIIFNSSFESGNLIGVQYQSGDAAGNRSYTATVNYTTVNFTDKHWWFYFSMQNAQGKTITIQLQNLAAADFGSGDASRWGNIEPVYSYDNINWERLPLSNVQVNPTAYTFTMTLYPTQDTVWLAPIPPYTIAIRDALLAEYSGSSYLSVSTLGITPGGLPLKAVTITDSTYSNENKYRVYVIAEQHANEVPSAWFADGMIRFLLNESNLTAEALRQQYIFKIVPIVNIDGVSQGLCRYTPVRNGIQYDLNREWSKTVTLMQPEIQWLYQDLQSWHPHAFIDVHSTVNAEGAGGSRDCMFLTPAYNTDPEQIAFMDNISMFWPESSPRSSSSYACSQVRSRLGIEPSISMEHPHDELRTMDPLRKLVTTDWQTWGGDTAQGIFSYFGSLKQAFLTDSEFTISVNDSDFRANTTGQDWYESRHYFSGGNQSLLTLNTSQIGSNSGKKAALKNYGISSNAYLSQEFQETIYNPFTVSLDIYIDRIQDNAAYDRTGHIYIGNNAGTGDAPTGTANERFVCLAFYDPTPGDTGTDLQIRARTLSTQAYATTSQWVQVTTGLSYDTWYTIKLVVRPNGTSPSYDVYVNDVLAMANIAKYAGYTPASVTFISFVTDSDARGEFFVDNVFSPSSDRHRLTIDVIGDGSILVSPGESTYADGTSVELTAQPALGWKFAGWSGDLISTDNPKTMTMDSDKIITATFQDAIPPQITNVQAIPASTTQSGFVNISCDVTDNIMVDTVKVDITGPAGFTPINVTMNPGYYYNTTYTVVGTYSFFIWADDTHENSNMSASYTFEITGEAGWNVQLNVFASSEVNDMVLFGEYDDASDGIDGYDIPKPGMPPAPFVYARFTTSLPTPYDRLWEEYKQYPGVEKIWNLSILWSDENTGYANITWDPVKVATSEYNSMYLYDLDLDIWTDMQSISYYNYTATSDVNRHFQIVCTSTLPEYYHEIIIHEEWNMISVCFNESYAKSDITVEYLGTNYSWSEAINEGILVPVFYGWDPLIQNYAESDVLAPGQAYWLYSYENCSLWILGQVNTDNVIQILQPAWNFVGCPYDEAIEIQDLVIRYNNIPYSWEDAVTAGLVMNTVFYWDVTIGNYNIASAIMADQGYWLYAYQICTLERGS